MSSQIRTQKKNQNARQAMVISGLNTIYRNTTTSHAIKTQKQTEPRIYFLNISLDDINKIYHKIHQIVENTRYVVKTKTEHLLLTETDIYEIGLSKSATKKGHHDDREQRLHLRVPVDGIVTIKEINFRVSDGGELTTIPVLIDESYYELRNTRGDVVEADAPAAPAAVGIHLPPNHKYIIQVKKTIKFHEGSPNAFVFVFEYESPNVVIDFYMTTEDGIISQTDKLNNTFKEDMISFLLQFKLCS
jgi:hypothetical protein